MYLQTILSSYFTQTKKLVHACKYKELPMKAYIENVVWINWLINTNYFDIFLTVHLSVILVINQLDAQNLV